MWCLYSLLETNIAPARKPSQKDFYHAISGKVLPWKLKGLVHPPQGFSTIFTWELDGLSLPPQTRISLEKGGWLSTFHTVDGRNAANHMGPTTCWTWWFQFHVRKKEKHQGHHTKKRLHVAECTLPKSSKFVWPKCNLFFGIRFVHTRVEDHIFLSCGLMNNLQAWLLVEDNSHKSEILDNNCQVVEGGSKGVRSTGNH